jgi:hypothetical protein
METLKEEFYLKDLVLLSLLSVAQWSEVMTRYAWNLARKLTRLGVWYGDDN